MFSVIGLIIACLIHHSAHGLPDEQIIGGTDAPDGKYPFQVSLKHSFNGRHICGGAIISSTYVLTAAHCLADLNNPALVLINVGSNLLSKQTAYTANELILHPEYNKKQLYANDIALIKTSKDIKFDNNTQPIEISSDQNFTNAAFMVTGWGTLRDGSIPDRLQEVKVTGCSQEIQQKYSYINDSQICTIESVGVGVCDGDAGGALIYDNKLVGIASFHEGTCANGNPDVFSRVFSYKSFLNKYTVDTNTDKKNAGSNQQLNILFGLFTIYLCIYSFL